MRQGSLHYRRSYNMKNVVFVEIQTFSEIQTHAIIDNNDGSFTSMPKSTYDEMIAAQENAPAFPVTPPNYEQTHEGAE